MNIKRVMTALREINHPGIKYSAFLLDDGRTFVHFVLRASEEAANVLSDLAAFQDFQKQLRASGPVSPPNAEELSLVGSSWDFF